MKLKKYLVVSVIGIFLSLFLQSSALAVNGISNRATFRGLKGVGVLVEKLPPEVEQEGLKRDQLQMEVESKLRTAGIKVLTKEEAFNTPGEPFLYININVNIAKTESDIYPYSIDLLLIQKVSLLRDPKLTSYAITWSTGGVGSIGKQILSQLRENVEAMVDVFIKTYLAENPK
jgi:Cdc6-like AAA superfamily ATPase